MSVLHRFSLGYSKTAGEIKKAAGPLLTSPPSQLTFRKMEEKRHIVLVVSPLHGGHLIGPLFSHLSPGCRQSFFQKVKKNASQIHTKTKPRIRLPNAQC